MSLMEVPDGWIMVNFPDYVFFQEGPGLRTHQFTIDGMKVINIKNMIDDILDISNTNKHISIEEFKKKYTHFAINDEDILIASSASIGKIAIARKEDLPLMLNTSIIRLKPINNKKLDKKFLYYFLKSNLFLNQIGKLATGSAQLNYGPTHLKQVKFIMPISLETQKKIVRKLDHILEQLEEKRKEILKLNEDTYLKLITFQKNSVGFSFVQYLKNEETKQFNLGELLDDIKLGSNQKADKYAEGIPVLRMPNIQDGEIDYSDLKYTKFTKKDEEKYLLEKYDVLVNRSNSPELVGKSAVFERDDKFAFASYLIRLRINRGKINPFFLVYYLNSPLGRKYVESVYVKTAGQANINSKHLKAFPISLPKLQRQDLLVAMMDKQKINTNLKDKIRSILEKRHRYEKMSTELQSRILNEAFSGKLVN